VSMLRTTLALSLVASCAAGSTPALRLRGGAPLTFSKLTKAPDVLKEGYSTVPKLEVTKQSDINGGTTLQSTFVRKAANAISHVLKATTSYQGFDLEGTIDNGGTITAEATYKDLIQGGDVSINAALEGGQKINDIASPIVSGEYRRKDLVANIAVKGSELDGSAVAEFGDIQVGLTTSYNADSGKIADPSIAARYAGDGFAVTASTKGLKGDDVTATYTQSLQGGMDVAGSFSTQGNKFSLGAAYKLDADSNVRAKVNSDGVVNVGYKRQVTKGATVSAGLEVDTNDRDKAKFGVSLEIK